MPEKDDEQEAQSVPPSESDAAEPGFMQKSTDTQAQVSKTQTITRPAQPTSSQSNKNTDKWVHAEHLAARQAIIKVDAADTEVKHRLKAIQTEMTRILTSLRWENRSVEETANRMLPLLNVGSVPAWEHVFIPLLFEIDRGGALIPVWLYIIDQGDPENLPADVNPAETELGRSRRFAILMLGNYRTAGITGASGGVRFARRGENQNSRYVDVTQFLGQLASDPTTSLYATQALVKHATVNAMEALIQTLEEAKGWAKVDVIEACLKLQQEEFNELIITSGLDNATGLENYIALPVYLALPLHLYLLPTQDEQRQKLNNNAALIFNQVLLDALNQVPHLATADTVPALFHQPFDLVAKNLFASAQQLASWQQTITLHRLGVLMGQYWNAISSNSVRSEKITQQIYQLLPTMKDVESWMNTNGRTILLNAVEHGEDGTVPSVKVLGEMQDTQVVSLIITRIENVQSLTNRSQALMLSTLCETLSRLKETRALYPMWSLVKRCVDVEQRIAMAKRRDNLQVGDKEIPGSIVYAAVVKATGLLGEQDFLDAVIRASNDMDPYVRSQALDALRRLDGNGDNVHSRDAARAALNDPRDTIVRSACQLVAQYRDRDAKATLEYLQETRPELGSITQDTLRQISM